MSLPPRRKTPCTATRSPSLRCGLTPCGVGLALVLGIVACGSPASAELADCAKIRNANPKKYMGYLCTNPGWLKRAISNETFEVYYLDSAGTIKRKVVEDEEAMPPPPVEDDSNDTAGDAPDEAAPK